MKINFGKLGLIAIAGSSAMLLASCENKVAQCNKIIGVANKATTEVQKTSQNKAAKVDQLGTMAASLDGYAKEMSAIEVKDEKLKNFQGRFVQMYQRMSVSSKALINAAKQKQVSAAQTALVDLKKNVGLEQPLVDEMNQYCQAK